MEAVDTSPSVEELQSAASATEAPGFELPPDRFLDRELSWLAFNDRVLDLAKDRLRVPLLERAKFLAIFANNLDEFYMVRVAGLKRRIAAGVAVPTVSGMMPREVHAAILSRTRELVAEHSRVFHFRNGGEDEVYLASADWMSRNLDRRIELLFPVAPENRKKVLDVLDAMFQDNVKGRRLQADGTYRRRKNPRGDEAFRAQVHLYKQTQRALERARAGAAVTLEPLSLADAAGTAKGPGNS